MRILNTRPFPKNQDLSKLLELEGFEVFEHPSFVIQRQTNFNTDSFAKNIAFNLDQFSDVILTSTFAAEFGLDFLEAYWPQWPLLNWWAIGCSTAKTMQKFQIDPIQPQLIQLEGFDAPPQENSETLLAALQQHWATDTPHCHNRRKVLIVAGENGRGLLESALKLIDIPVKQLKCYKREPNPETLKPRQMDAVILTSIESADQILKNQKTIQKFGPQCYFVCASDRIAAFAESKGALKVINSRSASNKSLSETLKRLLC